MFLSQKPILYAVNLPESTTLGADLEAATTRYGLTEFASRPNAGVTAFCGKVEAELAEMEDEEAAEFSPPTASRKAAWFASSARATSC